MKHPGRRDPVVRQAPHALPCHPGPLTPAPERVERVADDLNAKATHDAPVRGDRMIREVPADDGTKPLALLGQRAMSPLPQPIHTRARADQHSSAGSDLSRAIPRVRSPTFAANLADPAPPTPGGGRRPAPPKSHLFFLGSPGCCSSPALTWSPRWIPSWSPGRSGAKVARPITSWWWPEAVGRGRRRHGGDRGQLQPATLTWLEGYSVIGTGSIGTATPVVRADACVLTRSSARPTAGSGPGRPERRRPPPLFALCVQSRYVAAGVDIRRK